LPEIQKAIAVSRRLAHIIRQIADGIAWRTLRYDRALIYQLAMKPQTGHLDLETTAQEFSAASERLRRSGNLVVMNELTNGLRHGDYTFVDSDAFVGIVEVKAGRGSKQSGRATRQRRKLKQVVEFVTKGTGLTLAGPSARFFHRRELKSHLCEISDVIQQAKVDGSAHARLSDCLAVEAWYMQKLVDEKRKPRRQDPFAQSRQASSYSNLDFFARFARNLAPYSVFPFSDEDCTDLMTGAIWLITHFSHGNLVRCLRRRGLSVEVPTKEQMQTYASLDLADKRLHEDDVAIRLSRPRDPRVLILRQALLGRHLYEFLDEESFADAAEELLDQTSIEDIGLAFFPSYANEQELWD
jgi:hypothetical protein